MASGYTPKSSRKSGTDKRADLRPSWMWLAVPLLIIGAVIGVWWGLGSSSGTDVPATATPTPTTISRPQPSSTPTVAVLVRTPTSAAPSPTATATVLAQIAPGAKVKVVSTGGAGLNMRASASTNGDLVKTLDDGAILTVLAGPQDADGYTWWQVSDDAGASGWVADEWLQLQ